MKLAAEEIRLLAELDRHMDAGIVKYVVDPGGNRLAVSDDELTHFGLDAGQTTNDPTITAILERRIEELSGRRKAH